MTDDVLRLPFDQYQRYRMVADVLDRLRGDRPLRVLDVGGRTALLRRFVAEDRITLVDVEPSDVREGLVLGTGAALPFRDGAFDAVCAFDTLEHVPPGQREAFVAECARVAERWCILAGPYAGEDVARGEELLRRFLADKLETRHRYLEEHHEHGLPDRAAVTRWLEERGARVAAVGHGNLHRWLFMMCVELFLDDDPALREFAGDVFAYYNQALYASDATEPVYRHVVVAAHEGVELPDLDGLAGESDPNALRETLAPVALLTSQLAAFEAERARWRAERDDLDEILADRDGRLTEHADLVARLERELAEHREVLAARDADAEAYRSGIAELERAVGERDARLRWFPVRVLLGLRKRLGG